MVKEIKIKSLYLCQLASRCPSSPPEPLAAVWPPHLSWPLPPVIWRHGYLSSQVGEQWIVKVISQQGAKDNQWKWFKYYSHN